MGARNRGDGTQPPFRDRMELAAELTRLRVDRGLTVRQLTRATKIPTATLGGYFSGRHLPSVSQQPAFWDLLTVLGVGAADREGWWEEVHRLRRIPAERPEPYLGLRSYRVEDADRFVAREALTQELWTRVRDGLRSSAVASIAVVGPSGCGKTSLLQAGLHARLREVGVQTVSLTPGPEPVGSWFAALAELPDPGQPTVIIVDQVEAAFADGVWAADRAAFLDLLATPGPGRVVVWALRADYLARAMTHSRLINPLARQFLVAPLSEAALRRVIVEPAQRAGYAVADALVEVLIRDIVSSAAELSTLPLLSHVLRTTWRADPTGDLTVAAYHASGGLRGAVAETAEALYAAQDDHGRRLTWTLFSQLITLDADGSAKRRRVLHTDLDLAVADAEDRLVEVLEAFVAGRILSSSETAVEITHDIVLESWPRLTEWIRRDRDLLRTRERVTMAAADWYELAEDPSALLRGGMLELALNPNLHLAGREQRFLEASARAAQSRRARRHRARQLLMTLTGVTVALALIASLLAAYLVGANQKIEDQRAAAVHARNEAQSRLVAARSRELRATDPALSMQLALTAYRIDHTVEATSALLGVSGQPLVTRLVGPTGDVRASAGPGSLFATIATDGGVRLYRSGVAPDPVAEFRIGTQPLYAAAFDAAGRQLAIGGATGRVALLQSGRDGSWSMLQPRLPGPQQTVFGVDFADSAWYAGTNEGRLYRWPTTDLEAVTAVDTGAPVHVVSAHGRLVATGLDDGSVRIWRWSGAQLRPVARLRTGTAPVRAVAFSGNGRRLATGTESGQFQVWRIDDGRPGRIPVLTDRFPSWVNAVAFSPDSTQVAAAGSNAIIRIWDLREPRRAIELPGTANYTSVGFVDDGATLLTGEVDGTTRLWSLTSAHPVHFPGDIWSLSTTADGHLGYVGVGGESGVTVEVALTVDGPVRTGREFGGDAASGPLNGVSAVSPDGTILAAGSQTGRLRCWRLGPGGRVRPAGTLPVGSDSVSNVVFSADGTTLVAATLAGSVAVYDARSWPPAPIATRRTRSEALGLSTTASGDLIAIGGNDNQVHLWEVAENELRQLGALGGFENVVTMATLNASGDLVAGTSADRSIRVWDISDPTQARLLGDPLTGPEDTVFSVAWGADDVLGAVSLDQKLWLWSLAGERPRLLAAVEGLGVPATQVLPLPHLHAFWVAGFDGRQRVVSTSPEHVAALVCATAGSLVTAKEWLRRVPGAPYRSPC